MFFFQFWFRIWSPFFRSVAPSSWVRYMYKNNVLDRPYNTEWAYIRIHLVASLFIYLQSIHTYIYIYMDISLSAPAYTEHQLLFSLLFLHQTYQNSIFERNLRYHHQQNKRYPQGCQIVRKTATLCNEIWPQ